MICIAIAGRPNVGKSTLFNRLVGQKRSIVHDEPGVTRDSIFSRVEFNDRALWLVDTGGFVPGKRLTEIQKSVDDQVEKVVAGADLVLIVFDGRVGVSPMDEEFVGMLRKLGKPMIGVVNKIDPGAKKTAATEFYQLGISELLEISAEHDLGIDALKDAVLARIPSDKFEPSASSSRSDALAVAFLGRPNVGKSSLINRILNEPRLIVSEIPGTTRDMVDVIMEREGKKIILLDTAGIRRKFKITDTVEHHSAVRSIRAIERSNVVVLVIDAKEGITTQDGRIAAAAVEKGSGLLLAVNKWDLQKDHPNTRNRFREEVFHVAPYLKFAALKFVSAKTGEGVDQILVEAARILRRGQKVFEQPQIDSVFDSISSYYTASGRSGVNVRLYGMTQSLSESPTTFFVWCNDPRYVLPDFVRYFRNAVGEALQLEGVPIRIIFRRRSSKAMKQAREAR
jgi:GTPase